MALALRLAGHRAVADAAGSPPVLLLDDVFSELDPDRSAALLAHVPSGQALLTTASALPPGAHPQLELRVVGGKVLA
jgi:DNA replication and repair protein RecF